MDNYIVIDTQQNKCVNLIVWDGKAALNTPKELSYQIADGSINVGDLVTHVNNAYQKSDIQLPGPTALDLFNIDQFIQDLLGAFANDANILVYYAVIKDLAIYKNFSGMKAIINGLLSNAKVTKDEIAIFNGVLANQNINLDNF